MRRIDMLIAGVLVVAVIGSAVGVATYRDDRVADFVVTWSTRESTLAFEPFALSGSAEGESVANVTQRNLTAAQVVVTLAGQAARVAAVSYRVELVAPGVEPVTAEGSLPAGPTASVDVPLELTFAPTPSQPTVRAADDATARASLDANFGSSVGVGDWVLRVSLASSAPGPLAEGVSVTAEATLTSYEASVATELPEVGR